MRRLGLLLTVLLLSASCGHKSSAPAPIPSGIATSTLPGFVDFDFRVVLSGPTTASADGDITYELDYQRVSSLNKSGSRGFVIDYGLVKYAVPPQQAATLVSVTAASGPPPVNLIPQIPGYSENCEFGGDSGALRIVVRPTVGFTGPLTVRLYVKGTSIQFPSGSVYEVTTQVT